MESARFDMRGVAKEFDTIQLLPKRILLLVAIGLGLVLIATGVGMWLTLSSVVGVPSILVLIVMGVAILAVGALTYPQAGRVGVELQLLDNGFRITDKTARVFDVTWSSKKNRVVISDWRSIPTGQKGRSLASVEFVLMVVGVPVVCPITKEGVEAVIKSASASGLRIIGWSETPNPLPRETRISIAP